MIQDQRSSSKRDVSDYMLKGVELYLSASDSLKQSQLYVKDANEWAAFYLADKADKVYIKALNSEYEGNQLQAQEYLKKTIDLLIEIDQLLASHPVYRLDEWVNMARNQGTTEEESDAYETNAKRLITTWGGFQEDYAARFWSGLIKDYYIPRLKRHFSKQRDDLDRWEETWINTPWNNTTIVYDEPLAKAKELVNQAALI